MNNVRFISYLLAGMSTIDAILVLTLVTCFAVVFARSVLDYTLYTWRRAFVRAFVCSFWLALSVSVVWNHLQSR
jgi:hypothetical protein